ncbi:AAA family ATPase [Secundilactobacillus kimchicus]|uniref:AAA family ATPase n=1 Tax=Secundilactobacillus kimchicus TaxID=528209 RepID=UPI001C00E6F1|nr:AAA family ATPase [Secundilactobacillus kimchicus]MBT9670433.1 AAA family ATPase [Secundilactobacillus kimchicus]
MTTLPPDTPQVTKDTPRNFFIFGQTMSGKSYLAERFPHPIFLNTDGNAQANTAPSIQLKNERKADGTAGKTIIDQLDEIMLALQTEKHTFETVVIDVIDDVAFLVEQAVCLRAGVETLADIPYGKGFSTFNSVFMAMVMELKALPLNVIYVSRAEFRTDDNGTETEIPSLRQKYYNTVNGNCDLVIHTKKIGTKYLRSITDKRKDYFASKIDDPKILQILKAIPGALKAEPQQTTKAGN